MENNIEIEGCMIKIHIWVHFRHHQCEHWCYMFVTGRPKGMYFNAYVTCCKTQRLAEVNSRNTILYTPRVTVFVSQWAPPPPNPWEGMPHHLRFLGIETSQVLTVVYCWNINLYYLNKTLRTKYFLGQGVHSMEVNFMSSTQNAFTVSWQHSQYSDGYRMKDRGVDFESW
jgi:hypothetical protein